MNPAFSPGQLRTFLSLFQRTTRYVRMHAFCFRFPLNETCVVLAEAYGPGRRRPVDLEYEPMAWKADSGHYWRE